eukprot:gene26590-32651_t
MSKAEKDSGDRSYIGASTDVLRKVRSEGTVEQRGHATHIDLSLIELQRQWKADHISESNLQSKRAVHAGYLHNLHVGNERGMDMWSVESIAVYRERAAAEAGIFADYTGDLAKQASDDLHKPLNGIVSVTTPDDMQMHPIPVLETVSTDTRHVAIEDSLNKFLAAEKDIYGNNVEPPIINLDCGLNLLLSFLNAFLKEAWEVYDQRVRAESVSGKYSKSLIAWCKYHCIKSTKEWVYAEMTESSAGPFTKKQWVEILQSVEHHARVAKTVEAADDIMDDIIAVLSSKLVDAEDGLVRDGRLLIDVQLAEEPGSLEINWVGTNGAVMEIPIDNIKQVSSVATEQDSCDNRKASLVMSRVVSLVVSPPSLVVLLVVSLVSLVMSPVVLLVVSPVMSRVSL